MKITSSVSPALKICLKFFGVWPDVSYSTVCWLSFMLSMLIVQYFQYLYVLKHCNVSELLNFIDGLTASLYYSLTFLKLAILWIYRRIFHQILTAMDNDWRECINIDQHLHIMTIKANISYIFCNAMLSFTAVATVIYFLGEYVTRFIFLTEDYNDTLRRFPVRTEFPHETLQSPMFEFLFVILLLHAMLHGGAAGTVDGLIFTLVFHVSGQIDIICQEFRNISENIILHKFSVYELGMLIERHNRILSFSENIEKLFSFIALMQIVWNTLVICSLGFVFIISTHTDEVGVFALVKNFFSSLGTIIELFIICFVGEYLSYKGKSITNASYESLWYNMPLNHSKVIIFIIMRSQKRLAITAGKMMDMSFEAFTSVIFQTICTEEQIYFILIT
ncbi:odorant receptor 82a-like isoform X1 [Temnothorax americanus]|uniref:odorant receptor 82a-like isoform X1 n=1 Tax=Temnothorax americanus TaxID=1964332 RepID=UPI004067CB42